jgi:hypothetical protein
MAPFLLYLFTAMNALPQVNPRRYARTAHKLAARSAMAKRWEIVSLNLAREMERLWMAPDEAWRRWMDSERA